ncbi:hypothetical protein BJ085DRAFT_36157 [Dimargaris cristalligena]|uniref:PAW domain-containing protein n=1 Tax=Dimargaris cristalligena TaxID=215637 RepID=A0A4P9ZSU0_9FUNG|nr:hypothetical protein BJ085DRAFT_36157 [Dimargaris cristalligena]|eukprot:RKP36646.1 hypothetical protein BJ085DRAFT_36157 [Dimargaris cristalligena]
MRNPFSKASRMAPIPNDSQHAFIPLSQEQRAQLNRDTSQAKAEHERIQAQPVQGYFNAWVPLHTRASPAHSNELAAATSPGGASHTVGYNPSDDAFYENGRSIPLVQGWRQGCFRQRGLRRKIEYDNHVVYIARDPQQNFNEPSEMEWRLNFRPGGYYVTGLKATLASTIFTDLATLQWFIRPLASSHWQRIPIELTVGETNNQPLDLGPYLAEMDYGFVLKVRLQTGDQSGSSWQKTQLFRQAEDSGCSDLAEVQNLGFELVSELRPDIVRHYKEPPSTYLNSVGHDDAIVVQINNHNTISVQPLSQEDLRFFSELLADRLKTTSSEGSKVLSLDGLCLDPQAVASLFDFMENRGQDVDRTKTTDWGHAEWEALLTCAASCQVPALVELCEVELRRFVQSQNLEEITNAARAAHAQQLLWYCQLYDTYQEVDKQEEEVRRQAAEGRLHPTYGVPREYLRDTHSATATDPADDLPGHTMRGPATMNR